SRTGRNRWWRCSSRPPGLGRGLDRVAQDDDAAPGPGHGALDQDQLALCISGDHFEVQGRHLRAAHLAGHAGALEDTRRRGAGTDGARDAVAAMVTVRGALALEVV